MLLFVTILLSICLTASVIFNILLYKAGLRRLQEAEILQENNKSLEENNNLFEGWVSEFRANVMKTYAHMKLLDDKEMFSKDDDVGVAFKDMSDLIHDLNDRTQIESEKE